MIKSFQIFPSVEMIKLQGGTAVSVAGHVAG